jgi:dipeptidyl aminopeptidase/acylaminoacyl peptidase
MIAVSKSDNDHPTVQFFTSAGARAREPLAIEPIGLPTALAWSPDGKRIALINLPGRAAAEVWILTLADGGLRKLMQFPSPTELDGITWTPDGRSVIIGRTDYETEVLLLRGLR